MPLSICLIFVLVTTILALVVTDLGIVVDLGGAVVGSILSYITPGLAYFLLHKHDLKNPLVWAALGLALFGVLFLPLGVASVFIAPGSNSSAA